MQNLLKIMEQLRNERTGCPWDREQTYESIAPYTIEEAYEVADAIARRDLAALNDELGDLLFQVVFLSRIAEEEGAFDFAAVVASIEDKLVRRHPHVFGDGAGENDGDQHAAKANWEQLKHAERTAAEPQASALADIPAALPALKRASKLGRRAATVGFDWPDVAGVRLKLDEELEELNVAIRAADEAAIAEELGDVLFSVANLARHLGVDAEQALTGANRKFSERFQGMEADARSAGTPLDELDPAALERLWDAQKAGR